MHSAFIARHPIFNRHLDVVGCELLFRGHGWADAEQAESPQRATATVVLNSFTELDLKRIVGRKKAWVDVPREFVLDGLAQAIPASLTGLEISGSEHFDDELVAALRALKDEGYQLALDGFGPDSLAEPVLDLFDVVKLDVPALGHDGMREQVKRLRGAGCQILACGIATHDDRDFCVDAGCDLLQGDFFCRPAVAGTRPIPANRLALLQVVAALQRPNVELSEVEQLIGRDVALSFRMLRYVNSAAIGLRGEVRSIGQALALLGLQNARRWAMLSVLASVDDKPTELTFTALTRARFCELAGAESEIAGTAELFTLGLFSVLDALMDTTMREATDLLGLADDVRDALVDRSGPMGELLQAAIAREHGDGHDAPHIPHADEYCLRAVIWANNAAESLFAAAPAGAPSPRTAAVPGTVATPAPVMTPAPATAPGVVPAAAARSTASPTIVIRPERGPLGRLLAALGRLFGRGG